jgi:hypothetical protein
MNFDRDKVKEAYPESWAAAAKLIQNAARSGGRTRAFIRVNNRFEGNALQSIAAILDLAEGSAGAP